MILSGSEIKKEVSRGNISITPFVESRINPNSYNLTLSEKLLVYGTNIIPRFIDGEAKPYIVMNGPLDMKKDNPARQLIIPENGLILEPGIVYLGKTNESTFTDKYVPMLEGRSSIGRLGIHIHITAGFGDIGFNGKWTLEIVATQHVVIYPNVEIAQIYYHTVQGDTSIQYTSGKYQNATDVQTSQLYKEFQ